MKSGAFKKPSIEKVIEQRKLAQRRAKERAASMPRKVAKKPAKSTTSGNKKKSKTQAWYKKELDKIFSRYIRFRDDGQCFTCPKKDDPKKMQNGHFVPRQYLAVRWNEKNCNCQCYACNMLYGGQGPTYAVRLASKYGQETVEYLESQRWVSVKLDIPWYKEQIAIYKEKLLTLTS